MWRVNNYTVVSSSEQKVISYTKTLYDENGDILKSNIRVSTAIKADNLEVLQADSIIKQFLESKENS